MTRIAYVILCSCLFAVVGLLAQPASAGGRGYGNSDDGYYVHIPRPPERPARAWYSSECCYMKIVRHVGRVRQERFVKIKPSRMKKAWLEQKRERAAHRRRIGRRDHPDRRAEYKVIVVRRNGTDDHERCRHRRVRVLKPGGGWTWAVKARCD